MKDWDAPIETMWSGKFIRALRKGRWEFADRTRDVSAVVILAEHEGKVILVDQPRAALGRRCLELPAGLVGDEDPSATVESTAVKELEEEAGFTATRIERLGEYHSSPGMLGESFILVRAHGVTRCGAGGGTDDEDIAVHLVERRDIPAFVERKRAEGLAIDVKLLLFLHG